ncbi:hypothetical protein CDN99_07400 [Roseateles aquatilis]|uniref:Prepilin-type cleavage/methylation domain-containing protein n=1 Tax=Roseateles aquatilis TaxID=431061 RepID=A0A246JHX3_9BURK|nr:type IV pilin protein [Roseateles aquatilis]OWQ92162.1 hypothetical protein CDN99_07400 [Roseateles aquatilis]
MNMPAQPRRGFSLIELVVVLAIIAVLATLALPGFRDQVLRSRRAEAREALQMLQLAQERFRSQAPRYAQRLEELGHAATSRNGLYQLRIVQADRTRYAMEAHATGAQTGDRTCRVLMLSLENGSVRATGFDDHGAERVDACWPQ